jgi:chromosomal replication initiator protein
MKNKHELVWENCLKIIKDNINVQSYKTWFEPIKPVKIDGKSLTIQVPSQFFYEWLEEHYVTLLRKTIKRELGEDAKLEYRILVDASNGAPNRNQKQSTFLITEKVCTAPTKFLCLQYFQVRW